MVSRIVGKLPPNHNNLVEWVSHKTENITFSAAV